MSLRTFNQLETNAKITQCHRDQYINVLAAQVESVRYKWLTMASGYQLVEEKETYPLEECAKGEELKRVNNLNKETKIVHLVHARTVVVSGLNITYYLFFTV